MVFNNVEFTFKYDLTDHKSIWFIPYGTIIAIAESETYGMLILKRLGNACIFDYKNKVSYTHPEQFPASVKQDIISGRLEESFRYETVGEPYYCCEYYIKTPRTKYRFVNDKRFIFKEISQKSLNDIMFEMYETMINFYAAYDNSSVF